MVSLLRHIGIRPRAVELTRGVHVMGTRMAPDYEPPSMAMGPDGRTGGRLWPTPREGGSPW